MRNLEVKINEMPGPKVYKNYVLVEYETLTQAFRARERLKYQREHLLGDKKSEVTILIDAEKLTHEFPNVKNQLRYQRKRQITSSLNNMQNPMMMPPPAQPPANFMGSFPMGEQGQPPLNPNPEKVG